MAEPLLLLDTAHLEHGVVGNIGATGELQSLLEIPVLRLVDAHEGRPRGGLAHFGTGLPVAELELLVAAEAVAAAVVRWRAVAAPAAHLQAAAARGGAFVPRAPF